MPGLRMSELGKSNERSLCRPVESDARVLAPDAEDRSSMDTGKQRWHIETLLCPGFNMQPPGVQLEKF